jgi:hypothetical protein
VAQLGEAPLYKLEGRGLNFPMGSFEIINDLIFPHCDPETDSVPNSTRCISWEVNAAGA